ncbi:MAG: hypothetical protein RL757_1621 [Bacteroidota bacterium]|jgi:arginine-tRNA-protein transferase
MNLEADLFSDIHLMSIQGHRVYCQQAWIYVIDDETLDFLFEQGWRRSGFHFFRLSREPILGTNEAGNVLPLRIPVWDFTLTKSQRKIMRKNAAFTHRVRRILPNETHQTLFELHRQRFTERVPQFIEDFTGPEHDVLPTRGEILDVYDGDTLIATSFLDVTATSVSSIYAMFHPDYGAHSLGVYTMLLEIEYTQQRGGTFWYPGFAHHESSFYDYKKRFNNLEYFDWTRWLPYPRLTDGTEK